jgi:hypothetical protein
MRCRRTPAARTCTDGTIDADRTPGFPSARGPFADGGAGFATLEHAQPVDAIRKRAAERPDQDAGKQSRERDQSEDRARGDVDAEVTVRERARDVGKAGERAHRDIGGSDRPAAARCRLTRSMAGLGRPAAATWNSIQDLEPGRLRPRRRASWHRAIGPSAGSREQRTPAAVRRRHARRQPSCAPTFASLVRLERSPRRKLARLRSLAAEGDLRRRLNPAVKSLIVGCR